MLFQTYPNIEMIIVDDASTDKSEEQIEKFLTEIPLYQSAAKNPGAIFNVNHIKFIQNKDNLGNCVAFNLALQKCKGKYIIDLAADDVLMDERIDKQVKIFEELSEDYGVIFSNAIYINEEDKVLRYHFETDENGKSKTLVPSENVYQSIFERYFIPTATMMIRRTVLEELHGYDENLSYEDFDFWVRSSRNHLYFYQDEVTTLKREVKGSHSFSFYQKNNNPHLESTLLVCHKARVLNQNEEENQALAKCVEYHLRQSFYTQNFDLVKGYQILLDKLIKKPKSPFLRLILLLSKCKIRIFWLYQLYFRIRKKLV